MHVVKRKGPKYSPYGNPVGRRPVGEQTFTCTTHLDVKCAQWLQREAHNRGISRSQIMRGLIEREIKRQFDMNHDPNEELRMDRLTAS